MAKKCMVRREQKRERLVKNGLSKRNTLRKIIKDPSASLDEKEEAQAKIQRMKRDSSKTRSTKRCWINGRARGVYDFVGLSRNMFRIHAMLGNIPGLHKASW